MSNLVINANSIYDRVIRIGRQTENLVSSITFNLNMWIDEYGAGECVLNVRRNGDGSAYPVPMTIADGLTTWTITDTDTAKKGRGEIQLVYRAGDKVKTSPIFTISCGESLVGGEVPEPYEEWLTELNRMTAQVEAAKTSADQSAQAAQTAAGTATTKATEAEQSANTASGFAVNASASATSANTSAQAAAQSAEQVASSVSDVAASAQAASQSAQSAESAKQAAQTAEANAQGFAQTASEKASQAAESAANAAESVTDAQAEVTRASAEADRARSEAEQAANRIYDLLPSETANGPVASFNDGANNVPLKSLVIGITGGKTGMTVKRRGKNLFENKFVTSTKNGITATTDKEGVVILNGTATGSAIFDITTGIVILPSNNSYIVSGGADGGGANTYRLYFEYYNYDTETWNGLTCTSASAERLITTDKIRNVKIQVFNNVTCDNVIFKPMIRKATETDATFEPYNGTEVPIRWEPTIQNGTLDVLNGILTDTDTQTEYQIEAHEVNSLLGSNTIYADTGDTAVEYRADIQRYIDKRLSQ